MGCNLLKLLKILTNFQNVCQNLLGGTVLNPQFILGIFFNLVHFRHFSSLLSADALWRVRHFPFSLLIPDHPQEIFSFLDVPFGFNTF
jgi:hypothetical protein